MQIAFKGEKMVDSENRAKVPVYCLAQRPSRFIIDIPFAPTMADFFG